MAPLLRHLAAGTPAVAEFAFCDGLVRLFRTGTDPNIYSAWLAGRDDGIVVPEEFYDPECRVRQMQSPTRSRQMNFLVLEDIPGLVVIELAQGIGCPQRVC